MDNITLLEKVKSIAKQAGEKILDIYENEDFSKTIDFKADDSPLTIADKASHIIIEKELEKLNLGYPLLSEEGEIPSYETRKPWTTYWCIDPLDGTKEFIKRNGQFTVNIALIQNGAPTMGVVYTPVTDTMYFGDIENGAFKTENKTTNSIKVNEKEANRIAVRSKSHAAPEEDEVLNRYNVTDQISVGSSLKFCMIADGNADIYYRHGPTMEWDTAAGQAVLEAAGGRIYHDNKEEILFRYNKENLLNGSFLCLGWK